MLYKLCKIPVIEKIREIVFLEVDMLCADMMIETDLHPFTNLRQIQIIKCREFSMTRVAEQMTGFRHNGEKFQVIYIYYPQIYQPESLKGEDQRGAVVCGLFKWRDHRPELFIENLVSNEHFREFVQNATGSSADVWYEWMNRSQGDDDDADHTMWETYDRKNLQRSSHAASLHECGGGYAMEMPGICFPRSSTARRNAGDYARCHACRIEHGPFLEVGASLFSTLGRVVISVAELRRKMDMSREFSCQANSMI